MPVWSEELASLQARLATLATEFEALPDVQVLAEAGKRAEKIGKSSSQSWLGYQANVYYRDFEEPPAGEFFDIEFGLQGSPFRSSDPNWKEAAPNDVAARILGPSGEAALTRANAAAKQALERFEKARAETLSILGDFLAGHDDTFVSRACDEIRAIKVLDAIDIANRRSPKRHLLTQDEVALLQGTWAPPHVRVESRISAVHEPATHARHLATQLDKVVAHISRVEKSAAGTAPTGKAIFISHGRSGAWKDLSDFIGDRLRLPHDEFDRASAAGTANLARLSRMLDAAGCAFIILTAEDEESDGSMQARTRVIHEAGVFQGRLGFTRVAVLLEEGCEAFSSIPIAQIRFPKGNISARFEEIRRVLEREKLVS